MYLQVNVVKVKYLFSWTLEWRDWNIDLNLFLTEDKEIFSHLTRKWSNNSITKVWEVQTEDFGADVIDHKIVWL
jgi:hypothetical protein